MSPSSLLSRNEQQPGQRVGLLLAAGMGSRFGGRKLEARLADGRCMAQHAAANLAAHVDRLICVVRADDQPLAELLQAEGHTVVVCPATPPALSASIACGVQASLDGAWWLVALADMPGIPPEVYGRLVAAMNDAPGIVVPVQGGRRGHPVGFSSEFRQQLLSLQGDFGARSIIQQHQNQVHECAVSSALIHLDIDTQEQLTDWLRKPSR